MMIVGYEPTWPSQSDLDQFSTFFTISYSSHFSEGVVTQLWHFISTSKSNAMLLPMFNGIRILMPAFNDVLYYIFRILIFFWIRTWTSKTHPLSRIIGIYGWATLVVLKDGREVVLLLRMGWKGLEEWTEDCKGPLGKKTWAAGAVRRVTADKEKSELHWDKEMDKSRLMLSQQENH